MLAETAAELRRLFTKAPTAVLVREEALRKLGIDPDYRYTILYEDKGN